MQVNWNTQWLPQTFTTNAGAQGSSASSAMGSTFADVINDTLELSDDPTLSFPPKDAPEALQQAYSHLSESDKFALAATVLGMQAKVHTRVVDGRLTILGPTDPGYVNIYEQSNLSVGDFLNQMKQSVLNDENVAGYTQGREHVINLIDQLIQSVTQAGSINQSLQG
ncbi:hypothetical protein [Alicyclobacillus shizuokensis]|uniref:hypothetical protein n=1 Tax=Alicyclobacillus shizuokensis TaxID=392014 RepID=UPI00083124C9|nr:hypothetical protein [Alicyclobacillus shizuokensis]MCL6625191.1 hypothetical protein [Alicyclobacillus shizuokensis]